MARNCGCCGKFRKEKDLVMMAGESDDCGGYEQWLECKFCCSGIDYDRYFKKDDIKNEQDKKT